MPGITWNRLLPARERLSNHHARLLTRAELALTGGVVTVVLLIVWSSQFVHPTPAVHQVAQFVHLTCVVVGLGSVLVVDWYGLRWQLGHTSLESVVATAGTLTIPIWFGLCGLMLSGMFLEPDLTSPLTLIKAGMVMVAGVVGVIALAVQRRLAAAGPKRPAGVVRLALALALLSQVCWWGATVIGFLNRT